VARCIVVYTAVPPSPLMQPVPPPVEMFADPYGYIIFPFLGYDIFMIYIWISCQMVKTPLPIINDR